MNRLYVLIRNDLPIAYQAVQAGHAVAEWIKIHGLQEWSNETLVYLSVPDEQVAKEWLDALSSSGFKCAGFYEPDINNQLTAVAVMLNENHKKKLAKLPLLKGS